MRISKTTSLTYLLRYPRGERTRAQDGLHLLNTHRESIPCNIPADAFRARWARQTALISPELLKVIDLENCQRGIDRHIIYGGRIIP